MPGKYLVPYAWFFIGEGGEVRWGSWAQITYVFYPDLAPAHKSVQRSDPDLNQCAGSSNRVRAWTSVQGAATGSGSGFEPVCREQQPGPDPGLNQCAGSSNRVRIRAWTSVQGAATGSGSGFEPVCREHQPGPDPGLNQSAGSSNRVRIRAWTSVQRAATMPGSGQ